MNSLRLCALAAALIVCRADAADLQVSGVPNFHQVNEHIFRGGQPNERGWSALAKLGVQTVVDLRDRDQRSTGLEARQVEAAGMHYVNVPMSGLLAPSGDQMEKALALLEAGPVFVHCRRGADRTGTVVACYRIRHDGWDNQKALREAKGHGMSIVEIGMRRYILAYHAPTGGAPQPRTAAALP
jgi:protein tyrosine/serine phosphatase